MHLLVPQVAFVVSVHLLHMPSRQLVLIEDASECPERIGIVINTLAMEIASQELALVVVATLNSELAFACLFAALIIALVLDLAELIELGTMAVLLVIEPFTFIQSATIFGQINAVTLRLPVEPLAMIDVARRVREAAFAVVELIMSLTSIDCSILILDDTNALPYLAIVLVPEPAVNEFFLIF